MILLDPYSFDSSAPPSGINTPFGDQRPHGASEGRAAHSAPETGAYIAFLASLGIPAHLLRQGDIRPYEASYGELSRWEFQTLGTGRAHARRTPRPKLDDPRKNLEGS